MRLIFLSFSLFLTVCTSAQLSFPKGFRLVDRGNLSGQDDIYTNGRYSFLTHQLFREFDYKGNDEEVKKVLSDFFKFPFYLTKDSLCWGTGKRKGLYSYVVVAWNGDIIELSSPYNDKGFSNYSKWLLSTIRTYRKEGKIIMFPIRDK